MSSEGVAFQSSRNLKHNRCEAEPWNAPPHEKLIEESSGQHKAETHHTRRIRENKQQIPWKTICCAFSSDSFMFDIWISALRNKKHIATHLLWILLFPLSGFEMNEETLAWEQTKEALGCEQNAFRSGCLWIYNQSFCWFDMLGCKVRDLPPLFVRLYFCHVFESGWLMMTRRSPNPRERRDLSSHY